MDALQLQSQTGCCFPIFFVLEKLPIHWVVPLRFAVEWGIWELKGALALPKIYKHK